MFVAITNTPRDYAWGSATAIPSLLGTPVTGRPQAELWLGTHPGSPAQVVGDGSLASLTTLPFLLKVLAAAAPLSLQAHPTTAQAVEGFARENAAGVPLSSPQRNYKDELHKPELIFALTPFRALCGFRPTSLVLADLDLLGAGFGEWRNRLADGIRPTFEWLISRGPDVPPLIDALVTAAARVDAPPFALIAELEAAYPGDPGIAISLMLNLTTLSPGQVLFLPAGNIHAYIEGVGVELMAASDNVLRGGLTPKHVDVPELLRVLDFTPGPVPYLPSVSRGPGVSAYAPVPDFELLHVTAAAEVELPAEAVALCTSGGFTLSGSTGSAVITRGESLYISDEGPLAVTGNGSLFVAASGR